MKTRLSVFSWLLNHDICLCFVCLFFVLKDGNRFWMQTRIKRQNQANTRGDICLYKEKAIECVTLIGRSDVQDGALVARQGVRNISQPGFLLHNMLFRRFSPIASQPSHYERSLSLFWYIGVCFPFLILAKSIINFLFVYFFNQDSFQWICQPSGAAVLASGFAAASQKGNFFFGLGVWWVSRGKR